MSFDSLTSFLRPSAREVIRQAAEIVQTHAAQRSLTAEQLHAREMSLAEFVRMFWPIVEPSTPLVWGWHLTALCIHLEALLLHQMGLNRLLSNVPPGSMKSTIFSVMAPAWMWVRQPQWRSIHASGSASVAARDSMKCRTIIESFLYRRTFGIAWDFADDQNQKLSFRNTATGFRVATTAGARITGDRADSLFIDDPLDASDAYSKVARDAVNNWYATAFGNRLNDLRTGTVAMIAQRLHTEDLPGFVLATEPHLWAHLCIPQIYDAATAKTTVLGWCDPRTEDGELMFAERFPAEVIESEKTRLGPSGFAGQHLQQPSAAGGEIFKVGCLQLLPADALPKCTNVVVSLDTAFSVKQSADYSVAIVLGAHERGILLLDIVRGRYAYPQLKAVATELAARWRPSAVLVENKASGQSLIQSLQQETSLPVRAINVDRDKVSRAHAITPTWEAHRVFAPAGAAWLADFEAELYAFPKSVHDDMTDAFTQGVSYLAGFGSTTGLIEYYRREVEAMHAGQEATQRQKIDDDAKQQSMLRTLNR